ncbi:MAG TPA: hypothetical protein VGD65_00340 [Chryseosolibacter sp.]
MDSHYIIDNPNIPILCPTLAGKTPFGKFFDSTLDSIEQRKVVKVKSSDMYLPNFSLRSFEGRFTDDIVFYNEQGRGADLLGSCIFLRAVSVRSYQVKK